MSAQPPVATVRYRPEEPQGKRIEIEPNPIPVKAGVKILVWLQEENPPTPWRFSEIKFNNSTVFRQIIIQDRVITAVDVNEASETIEYTLCLVDETTGEVHCKDPQIENEFP